MRTLQWMVLALGLALAPASAMSNHVAGDNLTDGEVRKVDRDASKITIRHGPIANLDMPAMTMVFQVTDSALLERFKAGDRIRFAADKVDGAYVVHQIEDRR